MTPENLNQNPEEQPTLTLIQRIKDGLFDAKLLSKEQRLQCVEIFYGEALTEATMAQILQVSTKTISRDLRTIRERNALTPNVNLAKQIIGDFRQKMLTHHAYLMRLARSKDASVSEKSQAEYCASIVLNKYAERMQSLGYLPLRPQQIVGDLYHHMNDDSEKSLDEIKKMVIEMEAVSIETGIMSPEAEEEIKQLKAEIAKEEIADRVNKLSQKQQELKQEKEEQNDK